VGESAAVAPVAHSLLPVEADAALGATAISSALSTGALDIIAVRTCHGLSLVSAIGGADGELQALALEQAAEPCGLDRGLVHEVFLVVLVAQDETETFALHPLRALAGLHIWIFRSILSVLGLGQLGGLRVVLLGDHCGREGF